MVNAVQVHRNCFKKIQSPENSAIFQPERCRPSLALLLGKHLFFDLILLPCPHFGIEPALREQFVVRSLFGYLTCFQNKDAVCIDDRGKPVRNYDGRAAYRNSVERRLDFCLGPAVQCTGCFVKDQDRRIFQQCAGRQKSSLRSTEFLYAARPS